LVIALRRLLAVGLPVLGLLSAILLPEGAGSAPRLRAPMSQAVPASVAASEWSTPAWRAPSAEAQPVAELLAHLPIGDPIAALNAWLPEGASVAALTLRKTRAGAPPLLARVQAARGAVWLAVVGVAPTLRSPLPAAVGLRWARALRGPPAEVPLA
jgi:hypothetical protein